MRAAEPEKNRNIAPKPNAISATTLAETKPRLRLSISSIARPQMWEELHFAQVTRASQHHREPAHAQAQAAGRRHAVLERAQEVLVQRLRVEVAQPAGLSLLLEAHALVVRVVQLAEGVADLDAAHEALEALHHVR